MQKKREEQREVLGPMDLVGDIIAYENGELSDEATLEFFQNLVDTGLAWKLQGSYGRAAKALIEAGEIVVKRGRR